MTSVRRPSNVAQYGAAGWYNRHGVDYCRELRAHRAEFVETRRRVLIALAVVTVIGIAIVATGRGAMAAWFGLFPGSILAVILIGNELLIRRLDRKIASDCPEVDAPRSLP